MYRRSVNTKELNKRSTDVFDEYMEDAAEDGLVPLLKVPIANASGCKNSSIRSPVSIHNVMLSVIVNQVQSYVGMELPERLIFHSIRTTRVAA
jgi:hypothetical protein